MQEPSIRSGSQPSIWFFHVSRGLLGQLAGAADSTVIYSNISSCSAAAVGFGDRATYVL